MVDNYLEWEKWSLRVGFDAREGLFLRKVGFLDAGTVRPIIARASIAEMVVPYGDPSPVRSRPNYFDTGEYLVGRFVKSLELGRDRSLCKYCRPALRTRACLKVGPSSATGLAYECGIQCPWSSQRRGSAQLLWDAAQKMLVGMP